MLRLPAALATTLPGRLDGALVQAQDELWAVDAPEEPHFLHQVFEPLDTGQRAPALQQAARRRQAAF
jgi:hypothetical protein